MNDIIEFKYRFPLVLQSFKRYLQSIDCIYKSSVMFIWHSCRYTYTPKYQLNIVLNFMIV